MNDNKNKIDLAKVISKRTNQEENIAEAFINQFFFELSESIIVNPSTKIDGLGLFRIIKSSNGSKVLFLEDNSIKHKDIDLHTLSSLISQYKETPSNKNDRTVLTKKGVGNTNEISSKYFPRKGLNKISLTKKDYPADAIGVKGESSTMSSQSRIKNRVSPYKKTYIDTSPNSNADIEKEDITIIDGFPGKTDVENDYKRNIITREEDKKKHDTTHNISQKVKESEDDGLFVNNDFQYKSESNKKTFTSSLLLGIISILTILAIAFIIYLLIWSKPHKTEVKSNTENTVVLRYKEISVYDTSKYSFVIIPVQDTHIEDISQYYYGDKVFWPYIYYANIDFIGSNRIIVSGSIVKIPKLIVNLVEYRQGTVQKRAEKLGNEILKNKK